VVRERASDDRTGTDDRVPAEFCAREDDDPGTEPAPVADVNRDIGRPLGVDHGIGIGVAVVLVGDVDVRAGVDVVSDLEVEVSDDVAAAADHASVTDPHHRVGDHPLSRHHPGRDAHVRSEQRVLADADRTLAEDGARREGQAAALPEGPEPTGQPVARSDGAVPADPFPGEVDEAVEDAMHPRGRSSPDRCLGPPVSSIAEEQRRGPCAIGAAWTTGHHAPGG
jgi:hypothetical protein